MGAAVDVYCCHDGHRCTARTYAACAARRRHGCARMVRGRLTWPGWQLYSAVRMCCRLPGLLPADQGSVMTGEHAVTRRGFCDTAATAFQSRLHL